MRGIAYRSTAIALLSGAGAIACSDSPVESEAGMQLAALTPTRFVAQVGSVMNPAPAVRVTNRLGRPVPGALLTASYFDPSPAPKPVEVQTYVADAGGLVVIPWTLGTRSGEYRLSVDLEGAPPVEFRSSALAGPTARLDPLGGDLWAAAGTSLPHPVQVRLLDTHDNPVAGMAVTFTVLSGGGRIERPSTTSDAAGMATAGFWTLGPELGEQRLQVRSGDLETILVAESCGESCDRSGKLAFVRDGNIYISDGTGENVVQLTTDGRSEAPALSPDGTRIAFVHSAPGQGTKLVVMANRSGAVIHAMSAPAYSAAWSPDGRRIAYSSICEGQGCILVASADDPGAAPVRMGNPAGANRDPSFSPDGRLLAFVSDWVAFDFVYDIYVTDGTRVTQLTNGFPIWPNLRYYLHPAWSPDGRTIAFVYGTIVNVSDMRFTVAVMDADGGNRRNLAWAGDIPWRELLDPGSLSWSPEGSVLAYTFVDCDLVNNSGCSKARSIRSVTLTGRDHGLIIPNARDPSWAR